VVSSPFDRRTRCRDARAVWVARVVVLIATVISLLSAQLQVVRHDASHVHVACSDHAGAVEDKQLGASARSHHPVEIHQSVAPGLHKPCDLPPALMGGAIVLSRPAALPLLTAAALELAAAPEGVPGRTGPPLFHLAPKLSPPIG
jgi:hypothetical protein